MLTFVISLISINLLIIAHELGHFLVAKFHKVKVEEFSIGFPPKIFSFKLGEVIYSLNAIPFGAFVKINEGAENQGSFFNKSASQKAAIFLGGVAVNILIAFVIFVALFNIGFPRTLLPANYSFIIPNASLVVKYPLGWAIIEAGRFMYYVLVQSLAGLKIAFAKIFTRLDVSDLLGPVGLFAITSKGFEYGWRYGVYIVGLISYALAIFNLLPIPAVDGGRLLFLLIEKITKKPIPRKTEAMIDNIVLALLLFLAVLVTIKDVRFFYL